MLRPYDSMKYAVKTIHGILEKNYQGTLFECLFGTGQGSGASPLVWLTLVVILMNTIDKLTPNACIFNLQMEKSSTLVGPTPSSMIRPYNAMVAKLQEIAQRWENLLHHYSGSSLNLKKCFWFGMYWQWHQGRPQYRAIKANTSASPADPTPR
jgi:hypothetical protein